MRDQRDLGNPARATGEQREWGGAAVGVLIGQRSVSRFLPQTIHGCLLLRRFAVQNRDTNRDTAGRWSAKYLILLARPTGLEPVLPPWKGDVPEC
jgi:hypothetical protein